MKSRLAGPGNGLQVQSQLEREARNRLFHSLVHRVVIGKGRPQKALSLRRL